MSRTLRVGPIGAKGGGLGSTEQAEREHEPFGSTPFAPQGSTLSGAMVPNVLAVCRIPVEPVGLDLGEVTRCVGVGPVGTVLVLLSSHRR